MFAAGELAMTAHDLALWDESLIAQTILKPESYTQMFTEVKLKDGKGTHYGLGVEVRDLDGHREIEHSGEVSGFVSDNEVLIDDGAAIAVLTNQDASAPPAHRPPRRPHHRRHPAHPGESRPSTSITAFSRARSTAPSSLPTSSDYFTPEAIADFQSSLAPLGEPLTFRQTSNHFVAA